MDPRRRRQSSENPDGDGNNTVSQQNRQFRAGDASAVLDSFAQTSLVHFARRISASPKFKVGLLLWIVGFAFMVFAPPMTKVTEEMRDNYDLMVREARNMFEMDDAKAELAHANEDVYAAQVWFWRFRPEYREIVEAKQKIQAVKQEKFNELQSMREEKMKKAKAYVGIWSEYGMEDMRESFWCAFESGKVFASRQTFWQILFSSREENFLATLLQWLITALINFTIGLLGSLFYFVFSLGSLILSYDAGAVSGITFYVIALLGGASLVATYLFAMYGMAAGTVYAVGRIALTNAIKNQEEQRRRRLPNQQQHQHQQ